MIAARRRRRVDDGQGNRVPRHPQTATGSWSRTCSMAGAWSSWS